MPVMDKLEEISSGKKEAARQRRMTRPAWGREGRYCRGQGCRHPGDPAVPARETTAGIREDMAAVNMNVDQPYGFQLRPGMTTLLLSRRYRHLARGHPRRAAPSALVRRRNGLRCWHVSVKCVKRGLQRNSTGCWAS